MSRVVLLIYHFALLLHSLRIPVLPWVINKIFVRIIFGCQIGLGAKIGKGTDLGYGGLGIVIHPKAAIGSNVRIGTGVTIGGNNGKYGAPIIHDNCLIATGAKVLGPVTIGTGSIIGANAVVIKDVPPNTVYVGVPAKFLRNARTQADVAK